MKEMKDWIRFSILFHDAILKNNESNKENIEHEIGSRIISFISEGDGYSRNYHKKNQDFAEINAAQTIWPEVTYNCVLSIYNVLLNNV